MKTPEQKAAKAIYDRKRRESISTLKEKKSAWRSRYRFINDGGKSSITAHKAIVERVVKIRLPTSAEIHHVDGNGQNNTNSNLVVCPDHGYHALLHRRTKALDACGNANWLKCVFCKEYDDPKNMTLYIPKDQTSARANHAKCATNYTRERNKRKGVLHENSSM